MGMLKKRALSVILSFALVFGCFAGTGFTKTFPIYRTIE